MMDHMQERRMSSRVRKGGRGGVRLGRVVFAAVGFFPCLRSLNAPTKDEISSLWRDSSSNNKVYSQGPRAFSSQRFAAGRFWRSPSSFHCFPDQSLAGHDACRSTMVKQRCFREKSGTGELVCSRLNPLLPSYPYPQPSPSPLPLAGCC